MEQEKISTRLDIDPKEVHTIKLSPTYAMQSCMLCNNTRELPIGWGNHYPWVCNECKEAIAYLKDTLKRDPCEPIVD